MPLNRREDEVYEFGPFRLDVGERLLSRQGHPVPLAPKLFDTLVVFARSGGRLLSKDELMRELWPDTAVEEANLVVNISALRKVLGEGDDARYIETVPKGGYRLTARLHPTSEGVAASARSAGVGREDERRAGSASPRAVSGSAVAVGPVVPADEPRPPRGHEEPAFTHAPSVEHAGRSAENLPATSLPIGSRRVPIIAAAFSLASVSLALILYLVLAPRWAGTQRFQEMRIQRLTSTGNVGNVALSPDGNYFAYVLADQGRRSLWVRQVTASNAVQILPPTPGIQFPGLTFSPDGKSVYYVLTDGAGAGALYRVPVLGGTAHHLLDDIDKPVTFSPDGSRFAFVRRDAVKGESRVLIADAGGGGERTLATRRAPASFMWLAWSPDGQSIACSGRDADAGGEYANIIELRLSDGLERPFSAKRWHWVGQLAWMSDASGLIIAATDQGVGMSNQIWEVSSEGGEARRITNDLNSYVGLSLSADSGTLLAVAADRVSNIWVAPLDPGTPRQITATRFDGYWGLSWTPDGRLLYESSGSNQIQFWVTTADGTVQTQLTEDPHPKALPAASRDGRHIVFTSTRAGPMNLWRMGTDGSNPQRLTFGREGDSYPACSPDAAWVVYETRQSGVPTLWKVPLLGGAPTQLTSTPAMRPAVSPRGDYIAYWADDDAAAPAVAIIRSEGGEPLKRLSVPASPVGDRRTLRWSPTGDALTYVDTRMGVSNVWALPTNGGAPGRLTSFQSELIFDFDWSPDGRSLALSRGHFTRDVVIINDLRLPPPR